MALTGALTLALLLSATAAGQESTATQPDTLRKKGLTASVLSALIIVLLLFVTFVGVMIVLRHRLVPRQRVKKRPPTDATDLWSLAGQREARRKAGKEEPEDRRP